MRVFIVDDSDLIINSLTASLNDIPGVVVCGRAGNVADAINSIFEVSPDIVILDLKLPDGSGLDVLQKVKQKPYSPIIIVFSNYSLSYYHEFCLKYGAEYVFSKSEDTQNLINAVTRISSELRDR